MYLKLKNLFKACIKKWIKMCVYVFLCMYVLHVAQRQKRQNTNFCILLILNLVNT